MQRSLLTILFTLLIACREDEPIPPDVLSKEKMTEVMTDVQLTESYIQSLGLDRSDSTKQTAYSYYSFVFKKHNITPETFRKSIDYYSSHLELFSEVYDNVITELNKREAEGINR